MPQWPPRIQRPGDGNGPPPPGSEDRRGPRFIVGNALAGDTIDVCDFLDPGDGSAIQAAVNAANAAGRGDIWIRTGVYDLSVGAVTGPFTITTPNVTIEGGGNSTEIRGRVDQRAVFQLNQTFCRLAHMHILMPNAAPGAVGEAVVDAAGLSTLEDLYIRFSAGGGVTNDDESLVAAFRCAGGGRHTRLVARALPMTSGFQTSALDLTGNFSLVHECVLNGGDYAFRIEGEGNRLRDASIIAQKRIGNIQGGRHRLEMVAQSFGPTGPLLLLEGASDVLLQGTFFNEVAPGGSPCISIDAATVRTVITNTFFGDFVTAIDIALGAANTIIGFVQLDGAVITDLGIGTELAHTIA